MPGKVSILGLNARNLRYMRPYNPPSAIQIADDKLLTKQVLERHGIPTQKLLAVVTQARNLKDFRWHKLPASFVIKPNHGYGGGGIVIIRHRKKVGLDEEPAYLAIDKIEWSIAKLSDHARDILDGRFSLTNTPDFAFIEERIKMHPAFEEITFRGVPDVRVIVFNEVPVMAMLRLPTEDSKGKANVHQGAIAVGLDLANGTATSAMTKKGGRRFIDKHPQTKADLSSIQVPFWDDILDIAIRSSRASGLRYIGVDLALDRDKGPVVMEINARPGLEIQVANLAPLRRRLDRVEGIEVTDSKRSIRLAKDLFGRDIDRRVEDLSGRHVLGVVENVEIVNRLGKRVKLRAKVDTGAGFTAIDYNFAIRLGFKDLKKIKEELDFKKIMTAEDARKFQRDVRSDLMKKYNQISGTTLIHSSHGTTFRLLIPITFYLAGVKISTRATVIEREKLEFPMIIGRRNLSNFLIDPELEPDALHKRPKLKKQLPKK